MNVSQDSVRGRCQDRAALQDFSPWVRPFVPEPSEGKDLSVSYLKTVRLFGLAALLPLRIHPAGIKQRCDLNGSRKDGVVSTVSTRALIVLNPMLASFAQEGTSPHRIIESRRRVRDSWRIVRTGWEGGDVVPRNDVEVTVGVEALVQLLVGPGQSVSTAHGS